MSKIIPYCYFRVSTTEQVRNGGGLDSQNEAVTRYVSEKKDYFDVEKIVSMTDEGLSAFSGSNVSDGKLGEFLKAVEEKRVGQGVALVCYSIDRLSRQNAWIGSRLISTLVDAGIEIHSIAEGTIFKHNDPLGSILANIFLMRGNNESLVKSERSKEGYQRKLSNSIKTGAVLTKQMPRWLYDNGGGYSIDLKMKKIIEYIFENYIGGQSTGYIANQLNELGLLYKSTQWRGTFVARLIRDRRLLGEHIRYSKQVKGKKREVIEVIPGFYPIAIDKDVFNLANNMLESVAKNIRGRTRITYGDTSVLKNIFSGIICCGKCGGSTTVVRNSNLKWVSFIRCRNKHELKTCNQKDVKYSIVENAILNHLMGLDISKLLSKPVDKEVEALKSELEILKSEKKELITLMEQRKKDGKRNRPATLEALEEVHDKIDELVEKIDNYVEDDFIPNFKVDLNKITDVTNVSERSIVKKGIATIASRIKYSRISDYILIDIDYRNVNQKHILVVNNKKQNIIVNFSVTSIDGILYKCNSMEIKYANGLCSIVSNDFDMTDYSFLMNFVDFADTEGASVVKDFLVQNLNVFLEMRIELLE